MAKLIKAEGKFGGKKLILEKGRLADQATSAVRAQYGDTVVLATITASQQKVREGVDYLPLLVDYEEKMYAAGKIKGSRFVKREGRPTDEAVLVSRLVDRTLRPLFDSKIRNDIQVVISVLSLDPEANPHFTALIAASAALVTSGIPTLYGPIGAVCLAEAEGKAVINPSKEAWDQSEVNLLVAGTRESVNMIEAGGLEISESKMVKFIKRAHTEVKKCVNLILEFEKKCGEILKVEMIYDQAELPSELKDKVDQFLGDRLDQALFKVKKLDRDKGLTALRKELIASLGELSEESEKAVEKRFQTRLEERARRAITEEGKRVDGRKMDQLRAVSCEVKALPRTHGSAIFQRGLTQALSVVTLGSPGDEQLLDTMAEEGSKRYFHHYNFPAFSVGEVAPMRGPGRRDIGHGALAEKAIIRLLPEKEEFPYTIRVVTEVLSSNGSTSMAAVCGNSLSLMDAGVPLKKAVAGISMGIVFSPDKKDYQILTDIQGIEDHAGDMDFKVAGTADGINAMQMDVKMEGLPLELIPKILAQAKAVRLKILSEMKKAILKPRKDLSPYAPRIITLEINPDKIRDVIGPGGKMINAIIAETGVDIDIEDSGLVMITSNDKEGSRKAVEWVKNLTREVKVGEAFKEAKITRLMEFGAFAEVLPGQEGLIHVSEIAPFHVDRVENYLEVGQIVPVKVIEIDEQNRINLSCKNLLKLKPLPPSDKGHRPPGRSSRGFDRRRR